MGCDILQQSEEEGQEKSSKATSIQKIPSSRRNLSQWKTICQAPVLIDPRKSRVRLTPREPRRDLESKTSAEPDADDTWAEPSSNKKKKDKKKKRQSTLEFDDIPPAQEPALEAESLQTEISAAPEDIGDTTAPEPTADDVWDLPSASKKKKDKKKKRQSILASDDSPSQQPDESSLDTNIDDSAGIPLPTNSAATTEDIVEGAHPEPAADDIQDESSSSKETKDEKRQTTEEDTDFLSTEISSVQGQLDSSVSERQDINTPDLSLRTDAVDLSTDANPDELWDAPILSGKKGKKAKKEKRQKLFDSAKLSDQLDEPQPPSPQSLTSTVLPDEPSTIETQLESQEDSPAKAVSRATPPDTETPPELDQREASGLDSSLQTSEQTEDLQPMSSDEPEQIQAEADQDQPEPEVGFSQSLKKGKKKKRRSLSISPDKNFSFAGPSDEDLESGLEGKSEQADEQDLVRPSKREEKAAKCYIRRPAGAAHGILTSNLRAADPICISRRPLSYSKCRRQLICPDWSNPARASSARFRTQASRSWILKMDRAKSHEPQLRNF